MKRRVAGAVLFGFGLLCVVLAAALAWVIVPTERKVPYDLQPPDVVVEAPDATFVQAKVLPGNTPQVQVEHGLLRATTGIKPDYKAAAGLTGKLAGRTLIWNVYQATDWADSNAPISRSESRIALDRVSGAAVPWSGQCYNDVKVDKPDTTGCTAGNIDFSGQLYLFPFGTQKKTYQYYDGSLREALPMTYQGQEKYNGLPTYRFQQVVPRQNLPTDAETMSGLLGFLAPWAKTATMSYQDTRTMWVEPMTGAIVGYQEQQHRELVPDTGSSVTILDATFTYDQATLRAVHDQAAQGRSQLLLLGRYLPIGLLVVGLVCAVLGYLVTRRAAAAGAHRADDVTEPEPTSVSPA